MKLGGPSTGSQNDRFCSLSVFTTIPDTQKPTTERKGGVGCGGRGRQLVYTVTHAQTLKIDHDGDARQQPTTPVDTRRHPTDTRRTTAGDTT